MEELLTDFQYCGVPKNNIFDEVTTIRDTSAHSEMTGTPLCILNLDFKQAFDRVSHQYLYHILPRYGFSPWFLTRIKAMYDDARASIQLNGRTVGKISIQCAVRQGCPLIMALYAFCIHPFLRMLNDNIRGYRFGPDTRAYE
jgi:hypothetical protein